MVKKAKGLCPLLGGKPCLGTKCTFMGDNYCSVLSIDVSLSCIHQFIHTMAEAAEDCVCDHEEAVAGLYT
jgi:hypothetical protein